MKVEQLFTSCLAEMAYYIENNGEAIVLDPLRDIEEYLALAKRDNAKIKYIFLTHFHADFMAGHEDLAKATGGRIVVGPTGAPLGYDAHIATDGELFNIGGADLKLLHTPGHTTESISLVAYDDKGKEKYLFSGDALFIGDVGRPDLAQKVVADLTEDKLARMLFHSLREKIMLLPDDVIVYPNHGAGSPCGKKMSSETWDTLGNQKKTNYALRADMTEDEFVAELLDGLKEPPAYFPSMVIGNIKGTESIFDVREKGTKPLSAAAFEAAAKVEGMMILDTRAAAEFMTGFVPGAVNIDANGSFAIWVGTIFRDIATPFILVTDEGKQGEMIDRLARVGFDNIHGFLDGGFQTWTAAGKDADSIVTRSAKDLNGTENIIDVRRESEFFSEHVVGATNAPLDTWWESIQKVDKNKLNFLHCRSGNRSTIYSSILKREGYNNFVNIADSFDNIKASDAMKVTDYVCPSTML